MRVVASRCVQSCFFSCALWASVVAGCSNSEPFDHVAASQAALQNAQQALHGISNSAAFLEQSTVLPKVMGSDRPVQYKKDADKGIDDLTRFLQERIFAEGNLESDTDTSATYLMRPTVVCDPGDSGCVDFLTKNQVRLLLTSAAGGLVDVAVLFSEQRYNPFTFHFARTSLGLTVDLAASAQTVRALGGDQVVLPDQLEGGVLFELVKNAELDYSFRTSVTRDIAVAVTSNGKAFAFGLAATSPTWEARANGNAKTITLTENVGKLTGKLPLSTFAQSVFDLGLDAPGDDPLDVLLAGLTGSVTLDGVAEHLRIAGIGLGNSTSFVKRGQDVLFSVDVNPDNGRKFDLDFSVASTGHTVLETSPLFDLSLHYAFSLIADKVHDLPQYILDDTLRVVLSGDAHPSVESVSEAAWTNGSLKVLTGELRLTSAAVPGKNVTVAAGQCLLEQTAADDHPFSGFTAGVCQ